MSWYLNPALTTFRNEVNAAYPHRDKKSDGTIADPDHDETSDHQPDAPPKEEVDAWDMDPELNGVGQPYRSDIEWLITCFQKHESSKYWIWEQTIARRSNNWKREVYTGKYHGHVHWNTREEFDESTKPFGVGNMTTLDDKVMCPDGVQRSYADMLRSTFDHNYFGEHEATFPLSLAARITTVGTASAEDIAAALAADELFVSALIDGIATQVSQRPITIELSGTGTPEEAPE